MDNRCDYRLSKLNSCVVFAFYFPVNLSDSVEKLPYVGQIYARRLKRLKISTVRDLLYHFPFRYQDFSKRQKIRELQAGIEVSVRGRIIQTTIIRYRGGKFLTKSAVADDTGAIEAVWFNQPYLTRTLKEGVEVGLAGKVENFGGRVSFVNPEFEVLSNGKTQTHTAGFVPVYPETAGISSKWIRNRIKDLFSRTDTLVIPEFLPEEYQQREYLLPRREALRMFHFPQSLREVEESRRRFSFEELFLFNLRSLRQRQAWEIQRAAIKLSYPNFREKVDRFILNLPFTLTSAQRKAVREILTDLAKEKPMNRLLEGDVGSGKTVVAAVAAYLAFLSGTKTIFMAPTEILADQHFQTLKGLLSPEGVKIALHTGSKKQDGEDKFDLWIGTHALFYRKGNFRDVGLVVIDEQHRFGVEQRAKLLEKSKGGVFPHLLTLTATPIPRTLALTVYGDLDLSILNELPPGRKKVKTFAVPSYKREAGYQWIRNRVKSGEQAFVVCPLIEESNVDTLKQVKAATAEYQYLKEMMPDINIGLLHGRMTSKEKVTTMEAFKKGETGVLVSTPVVEVGIDIPNATIMVVEAAERFGLASLHQLRGRVGRGEKDSYCFLFTEENNPSTFRRLKELEKISSGFELAELDLKLRGPGEMYGVRQHGLTELKVADLTDTQILKISRDDAKNLLTNDPTLSTYPALTEELRQFSTSLVEPN